MKKLKSTSDLRSWKADIIRQQKQVKTTISVCGGTGCHAYGCKKVRDQFAKALKGKKGDGKIRLKFTGCRGLCERGPIVTVQPQGIFYQRVQEKDVPLILSETVRKGKILGHLLYDDAVTKRKVTSEKKIPFYKAQRRLVLGNNGLIEPTQIEDYIGIGGYQALSKALFEMKPEEIIDEIKSSGLRGRGGAGFSTGRKWEDCRNIPGNTKYIICNCDEGDPGAYMDRSLLEGNPQSVLEGMIIGAYAIGANHGFIYVRHEYPLACKNAEIAIKQARRAGLLGKNILGSGFDFDAEIAKGGGAFVCGESTALIASIEGRMGEPRSKQIHLVEQGLWGKPTNLNNVETWANVPLIIHHGSRWFSSIGTEKSKGTKIFSLVGRVKNTGLVEVPMGITLEKIIFDIGGGQQDGKKIKAVQTGGPSGGCIPASLFSLPVDFDSLTKVGSMMGSGGMIVMDEGTCMVDVAKYFVHFLQDESCGKCLPCREGLKRMGQILDGITEGKGNGESLSLLEELAEVVADTSLCGLGKTAPNPVLSALRYFRPEFEAHIHQKRCPAAVCTPLIRYSINEKNCVGCTACAKVCPTQAIQGERKQSHFILAESCSKCGSCREVCKSDAVMVQ
ncbi:MAG TPA: NADH-ubiquinone oxidoreductase-F iron-sulfur binding region domain-containing protein [Thermodesulfobacteriota bacterium]|nr:NADH-ubiquinone oxidoreductase-F iron-sulfur binding region domain-containing protein [Thermodesulfobacteriota bacterium]